MDKAGNLRKIVKGLTLTYQLAGFGIYVVVRGAMHSFKERIHTQ